MNQTLALLVDLRRSGATITTKDNKFRCDAPKGVLTEELKAQLKVHKDELIRLLKGKTNIAKSIQSSERQPYPDGLGRVKCCYCLWLEGCICQMSGNSMSGIALLRECEHFCN
jgi:hypothetical protein